MRILSHNISFTVTMGNITRRLPDRETADYIARARDVVNVTLINKDTYTKSQVDAKLNEKLDVPGVYEWTQLELILMS